VASESKPPPPPTSGGARYAIIGVALVAIAALAYCLTTSGDGGGPQASGPSDAGVAERPTSLVDDDLIIPEPEIDGGPQLAERPIETHTKHGGHGPARAWDDCSGDIAPAEARRVIDEFRTQIRNCYERQLKMNPALEGNMTLALRISASGHVEGSQVSGSLRDREVFACVRNVASHMRFPAPGGRDCAIVQVPYTFTPQR
jgi:hypothetical protein